MSHSLYSAPFWSDQPSSYLAHFQMSILCILIIDLYTTPGVTYMHVEMKVPACTVVLYTLFEADEGKGSARVIGIVLFCTVKRDVSYTMPTCWASKWSITVPHHSTIARCSIPSPSVAINVTASDVSFIWFTDRNYSHAEANTEWLAARMSLPRAEKEGNRTRNFFTHVSLGLSHSLTCQKLG